MAVSRVANSDTFKVSTPSDTEIRMTRLFDAPRQLVFEAMTKPEHVRKWWGCISDGHRVTVCEIDLRVGGKWRFVHAGPEGEYPAFYGEYKEIDAPGRLVYTEIFEPYPDGDWWIVGEDHKGRHQWGEVLWLDDPVCDRGSVNIEWLVSVEDVARALEGRS